MTIDKFFENLIADTCGLINASSRFMSFNEEFDPGSERTLAAWLRHASRARKEASASE